MPRLKKVFSRIRRQPAWRVRLFLEAVLLLAWSRVALRLLPFRHIAWFLDLPLLRQRSDIPEREQECKNVEWAIGRGAMVLPGETVCFPRAIAAHVMCRTRGIDTTLYYGAAILPDSGLTAHVWLQDGLTGVVGKDTASAYCVLTQFPVR